MINILGRLRVLPDDARIGLQGNETPYICFSFDVNTGWCIYANKNYLPDCGKSRKENINFFIQYEFSDINGWCIYADKNWTPDLGSSRREDITFLIHYEFFSEDDWCIDDNGNNVIDKIEI